MTPDEAVAQVAQAESWDARVAAIRLIPERFGIASHQEIFSAIARRVYVPSLAPDFAYVHWREDYELRPFLEAYQDAYTTTDGFSQVTEHDLTRVLTDVPRSLRVFRLMVGFTAQEFAAATRSLAESGVSLSVGLIRGIESGRRPKLPAAAACARVIDRAMRGMLFASSTTEGLRLKIAKPDTQSGWNTIRDFASNGVPLPVFLHQRLYGGAFRQLLDATSSRRGDVLEEAVESMFNSELVPHIRTGSNNQEEIAQRFGITVKPAPDFVVFDRSGTVRAVLECKGANDGGTARDKAARFRALRTEASRLGGIPVFAVLSGLGWTRTADALGPVIRDTDGRVFTIPTLREILSVQPFPTLAHTQY
jgi:hypothetical protein